MFKPEGRLPVHGNAFTMGLRELNLERSPELLDNALISAFSKRCPNLVKLNLSYAVLSPGGCQAKTSGNIMPAGRYYLYLGMFVAELDRTHHRQCSMGERIESSFLRECSNGNIWGRYLKF